MALFEKLKMDLCMLLEYATKKENADQLKPLTTERDLATFETILIRSESISIFI